MEETIHAEEQSIVAMYRGGVSLRTLEIAFGKTVDEIIEILHRHGAVERQAGESWDDFLARVREDVKHAA